MINLTKSQLELIKFIDDNSKYIKNKLVLFKLFAKDKDLSYASVRNKYYSSIKNLRDEDFMRYQLNSENHIVEKQIEFTTAEINNKLKSILELTKQGKSLRASCLSIANYDKTLALRYQNKIRNLKLANKLQGNFLNMKIAKNSIDNQITKKESANSIQTRAKLLTMPQANILSEQDMQHLFMGLMRLIKRSTEQQLKDSMKMKFNDVNKKLQKALNTQQNDYEALELENNKLKEKLANYEEKMQEQIIAYNEKIKKLQQILSNYNAIKK